MAPVDFYDLDRNTFLLEIEIRFIFFLNFLSDFLRSEPKAFTHAHPVFYLTRSFYFCFDSKIRPVYILITRSRWVFLPSIQRATYSNIIFNKDYTTDLQDTFYFFFFYYDWDCQVERTQVTASLNLTLSFCLFMVYLVMKLLYCPVKLLLSNMTSSEGDIALLFMQVTSFSYVGPITLWS